ncbi:hypothetical protein A0U40_12505 [[Bacillus] sp. KCTC 13219]|nr:hypothetical protein A0U40_12505 [[Bacillus] sp. KCTC 13219]
MMMRKRTKISKPNYKLAENKALEFIKHLERKELPIKLLKFKKIFHDLEIKTYSWYSKKMGLSIEKVCEDLNSEDGCCVYNESNSKYRIYYNDTIDNEGRKRWTIAHELGHYALQHNKKYGFNIMQRKNIPDEQYRIFEQEANCFARTLLAPPHVIFHINNPNPMIIQEICNISLEAAVYTHNFIRDGVREYGIGYSKDFVKEIGFGDFLFSINNRYFCKKCRCNFVREKPEFCPCCGNASISKTHFKYGDDFNMIYPATVEVDFKGRAKTCPQCKNEELDYEGDYCNICSTYLVNECSSTNYCGTALSGNARYCHKCGSKSTFLNNNHLKEWDALPF